MDERESHQVGGPDPDAMEVASRVGAILAAADEAATAIARRAEREADATRRRGESDAAARVREAQEAGEEIRRGADAEAARRLEEARRQADRLVGERTRRIRELSDSILGRGGAIVERLDSAETARRQLEGLVDALGRAAERLGRELTGEDEPPPATRSNGASAEPSEPPPAAPPSPAAVSGAAPPPSSPEPERAERPLPPLTGRSGDRLGGARLVALQMAVAGSSRSEVEYRLQEAFALEDSSGILDPIFGGESGGPRSHAGRRLG